MFVAESSNQDSPEYSCEEICEMYCPEVCDHEDSRQLSFLESVIN